MNLPVIVIGGGGHAKVVIDALNKTHAAILGRTEAEPGKAPGDVAGTPCLGDDMAIARHDPGRVLLANGVGSTGDVARRAAIFETWRARGFRFVTIVHPSATVAGDVEVAEGVQIMAGCIVQTGSRIGANAILNTGARVDHDCDVGAHAHVAPGAILCGTVRVGPRSHVGAGAVVIQNIVIGEDCRIAAGATVVDHVPDGGRVGGVPARPMRPMGVR